MTTRYEETMYNDIHRIANALEKLVKIFEQSKTVTNEMNKDVADSEPKNVCPRCGSNNICYMYTTLFACDCKTTHYTCLNCHKEFDV